MAECTLCESPVSGALEFCKRCYQRYREDIKSKKPWVRVVKNDAQKQRRRREKEYDNHSLDALLEKHQTRFAKNVVQ